MLAAQLRQARLSFPDQQACLPNSCSPPPYAPDRFFKVPGRTGDSCIPGAAAYVDGEVGACGCTGQVGFREHWRLAALLVNFLAR